MKIISEQRATLIAAWISTGAALIAAVVSLWSGRQIAEIENRGAAHREMASFRRSQIDQCSKLAIDSSIELLSEVHSSAYVPWIIESREVSLVDQANRHIERLRHAHAALVAMGAISSNRVDDVDLKLRAIINDWQMFSSSRDTYRRAVTNGDIKLNGQTKTPEGEKAEANYLEARRNVEAKLASFRRAIAEIYGMITIPER